MKFSVLDGSFQAAKAWAETKRTKMTGWSSRRGICRVFPGVNRPLVHGTKARALRHSF